MANQERCGLANGSSADDPSARVRHGGDYRSGRHGAAVLPDSRLREPIPRVRPLTRRGWREGAQSPARCLGSSRRRRKRLRRILRHHQPAPRFHFGRLATCHDVAAAGILTVIAGTVIRVRETRTDGPTLVYRFKPLTCCACRLAPDDRNPPCWIKRGPRFGPAKYSHLSWLGLTT